MAESKVVRNGVFRVGDLTVDAAQRSVRTPTGAVDLPRLSFDLLLTLIMRAPAVVSNEELAAAVWPGLVVAPETVTKRINLLRDALGDDAARPRYVAGLRGHGYRLVAPVELVAESSPPSVALRKESPPAPSPESSFALTRRVLWPLAVAALLAVVGLAVFRSPSPPPPDDPAVTPVATTVAVLPFDARGATDERGTLAYGLADMILDRLSTVPQLTVIARGSAFNPALRDLPPREIGRALHARYLVDGSAQRSGDALRVTVRLVDARDGTQAWSTHLDRPVADLFSVQDEIAEAVAAALRSQVDKPLDAIPHRSQHQPPVAAQLAYLEARALLSRTTIRDSQAAARLFQSAIEQDPRFAAAHAGLYDARMLETERRRGDLEAERRKSGPLLEQAFALDPECGTAYLARAIWSSDAAAARDVDFRRGIELDPSNGRGLVAYAEFLNHQHRDDEARKALARAEAVDPMSPRVHFLKVMIGWEARGGLGLEAAMRGVLAMDPSYQPALQRYAKYRWMQHGELAEATQLIERAIALDPENPWSRHTAVAFYLDLGDPARAAQAAIGPNGSIADQELLLPLQRGDTAAAAAIATLPQHQQFGRFENWGEPEAVRDEALRTRRFDDAIRYLRDRFQLHAGDPLGLGNFRAAACLAQLLTESGDTDAAHDLLTRLPPAIDRTLAKHGTVFALRSRAMAEMQLGQRERALATLIESFRSGDLTLWWYALEREPLFQPLHDDPRFRALVAEVRARVDEQRKLLERARAVQSEGEVVKAAGAR